MDYTLILLDVDGVLVHPVGYKAALRATVDHFMARMGLPAMGPDDDEIAVFEACGITNEWDSGAMCVSAVLLAALDARPDLHRPALDDTLAALSTAGLDVPRPDFVAIARTLTQHDGHIPTRLYLERLREQVDETHLPLVAALLEDVYDINNPTTRLFQNHTLGSARFADTYGQPALLDRKSTLKEYDIPLLNETMRDQLVDWQRAPDHGATIFTARPSLPPADLPDRDISGYAPEGELASELLGLDGHIPLIGMGRMAWLATQHGRQGADYVKPSPVQALAAIGAAASGGERAALDAAAALYEHDMLSGPLADLAGHTVRVVVFEDAVIGVQAGQRAVERLRAAGLDATFEGVGVSPNPDKRAALAQVADRVVDDVNEGLAPLLA